MQVVAPSRVRYISSEKHTTIVLAKFTTYCVESVLTRNTPRLEASGDAVRKGGLRGVRSDVVAAQVVWWLKWREALFVSHQGSGWTND